MRDTIVITLLTASISFMNQAQIRNPYYPFASQTEYAEKVDALNEFVTRFGQKQVNRIFVAKVQTEDGNEALFGYWKEDNSILILEHFSLFNEDSSYYWLHHKARIDLETDVVPTKEDIGGSTYLVDKPWVDGIVKACLEKSRKLVIHKQARPKKRA